MRENVMPNDPDLNDPRNLWQNQEEERMVITLDDVRSRAARFERRIRRRNLREYVAGAIVIAFWGASPWFLPFRGWQLAAALLSIAGTIFVLVQLHRRGAAGSLPIDAGLRASLDFHIRELERQRKALHTVWIWYLLPFLPGFVAEFLTLAAIERGINAGLIGSGVILLAVFVGIWRLNESAARNLDHKIQELRAMETDHE
jgi:hypothetical protein